MKLLTESRSFLSVGEVTPDVTADWLTAPRVTLHRGGHLHPVSAADRSSAHVDPGIFRQLPVSPAIHQYNRPVAPLVYFVDGKAVSCTISIPRSGPSRNIVQFLYTAFLKDATEPPLRVGSRDRRLPDSPSTPDASKYKLCVRPSPRFTQPSASSHPDPAPRQGWLRPLDHLWTPR
jgi:hypothetical protein